MYKKYAKIKRKYKSKRILKPSYIILLIILIMIIMAVGYSYFQSSLTVNGVVASKILPLDIAVNRDGADEGRWTTNSDITYKNVFGQSKDRWVATETYDENIITLSLKDNRVNLFESALSFELTLKLTNTTNSDFKNGQITLYDARDGAGAFRNANCQIVENQEILPAGEDAIIKITGDLRGNVITSSNTYYKFRITYEEPDGTHYFWYIINLSQ